MLPPPEMDNYAGKEHRFGTQSLEFKFCHLLGCVILGESFNISESGLCSFSMGISSNCRATVRTD